MRNNGWYEFIAGDNFKPEDLYKSICETMLDNNQLEIERNKNVFRWKIMQDNVIKVICRNGETLHITVS